MNFKEYLTEEIDSEVKKIKVGDQISFYIGKGKSSSSTLHKGKVKKITKDSVYITTSLMYDYESLKVDKKDLVLDK